MTISWSFSYIYFVKFHDCKKIWEPQNNHGTFYPNPCYNKVCYKWTTLYNLFQTIFTLWTERLMQEKKKQIGNLFESYQLVANNKAK